jgi:AcrR family transcriptional regulator
MTRGVQDMARTVKDPSERRDEFLDTAVELFKDKGYYNTSVEDIVDRMCVAKGLFYYYFRTKEDLVEAIVNRLWEGAVSDYEAIMARDDLNALEKLFLYSSLRGQVKVEQTYLMDLYIREPASPLVQGMMEKGVEVLVPILGAIFEQGVEEGTFNTEYPYKAAEFLIRGATALLDLDTGDPEAIKQAYLMTLDLWERVLGAEKGSFIVFFQQSADLMDRFAEQAAHFKQEDESTNVKGDD